MPCLVCMTVWSRYKQRNDQAGFFSARESQIVTNIFLKILDWWISLSAFKQAAQFRFFSSPLFGLLTNHIRSLGHKTPISMEMQPLVLHITDLQSSPNDWVESGIELSFYTAQAHILCVMDSDYLFRSVQIVSRKLVCTHCFRWAEWHKGIQLIG